MRIHFCDICNESVPQSDLDKGRAALRKGRVICVHCEVAMSGDVRPRSAAPGAAMAPAPGPGTPPTHTGASPGPPPAPSTGSPAGPPTAGKPGAPLAPERIPSAPPSTSGAAPSDAGAPASPGASKEPARPSVPFPPPTPVVTRGPASSPRGSAAAVAVALAVVALLFAAGGAGFLYDLGERRGQAVEDQLRELRRELAQSSRELDSRIDNRLFAVDERLGELVLDGDGLRARIDETFGNQRGDMEELRLELVRLAGSLGELEALAASVERHERDLARVSTRLAGVREEVARLGERLVERPAGRSSPGPIAVGGTGEDGERPEWWDTLAQLDSQNASTRWQAVQTLGNTGDAAVAEHLFPMMRDVDIFVRMATARILGDLQVPAGVPVLIDALEDAEASVREAAVVALRSLAGLEHGFDPTANDAERAKRVKAWRDWWRRSADELLEGAAPARN